MELTVIIVSVFAIVAANLCEASVVVGGGSYTDGLLGGLRRPSRVGRGPLIKGDLNRCDCPLGTVCSVERGIRRCIDEFGNPIGGIPEFRNPGNFNGYQVQPRRCGYMSDTCLATVDDIYPTCKYTWKSSLNACVQVNVCKSCAYVTGVTANLFDSTYECRDACSRY